MTFFFHRLIVVFFAVILDFFFGDPENLPHIVVFFGKSASKAEKIIRPLFKKDSPALQKTAGALTWAAITLPPCILSAILFHFLRRLNFFAPLAIEIILAWQCLAAKTLSDEAKNVQNALSESIDKARAAVSRIVGRDTQHLSQDDVIRATIETVAENTTDGVTAPLIALIVGGVPFALFFKAISTLDSMFGYKNERYRDFGFCSAKADDIACFLPSRISAIAMIFASFVLGYDYKSAKRIFLRDRLKHESPNSAQTESVAAGALGIRLGGPSFYEGKKEEKPFLGDETSHRIEIEDISRAVKLMWYTYAVIAGLFFMLSFRRIMSF